jgi:hypothetical protein
VHKCTKSDWEKFPPAAESDRERIDELKKRRVMYCLSEKDAEKVEWR